MTEHLAKSCEDYMQFEGVEINSISQIDALIIEKFQDFIKLTTNDTYIHDLILEYKNVPDSDFLKALSEYLENFQSSQKSKRKVFAECLFNHF